MAGRGQGYPKKVRQIYVLNYINYYEKYKVKMFLVIVYFKGVRNMNKYDKTSYKKGVKKHP